jgi:WD40 repeat protein
MPAYPLEEKRLDGQLSFSIISPSEGGSPTRFHFQLDLPIHPAQTYLLEGYTFEYNEAAYNNPVILDRVVVTPAFTQFYLCYAVPTQNDWMIGHDASLRVGSQDTSIQSYALLFDSVFGDGTKGGEPGWQPIGNYPRCVKIGFPIGSDIKTPTNLTLTIPTLEQSMPEVIPQEALDAAYPKLRAQGIDMEWRFVDHGAYPEYTKLPTGMSEQEAFRKFNEALGYIYTGPWVFKIRLEPRTSSQPVFSTSTYGAATPIPLPASEPRVAANLPGWIRSFDVSPDQKTIAFATSQGVVLYDIESYKHIRTLNETENFFSVDWSPDGKKLAAGGLVMQDSEIGKPHLVVWDTADWQVIFEPNLLEDMTDTLYGDVAWSPDGRFLATSNGYMGVTTFDIQSGKVISGQDIFSGAIADISWSPDGSRLVATGDMAYAIRRWKVSTDESVRLFDQRASSSIAVEWSPDGERIASGHQGGAVCFWTAGTNQCDGFIYAHQTATFSLAWSPDGSQLATGGGVIRIWDSQTGNLITAFGQEDGFIYTHLAWLAPQRLVSLERGYEYEGKTIVRFWGVDTGSDLIEFQGGCCLSGE